MTTTTAHADVLAGLAEVLHEVAGSPVEAVTPAATFILDLDVDSLTMVEVVVACEERFGIRIPDEDLEGFRTVGDAVTYIAAARSGA
ncbi:MAG: acyl carrier protein [Mycobacterium sp.]|jgi:acyl carrier protein|nr:acyl carrier protein [Mycobacterium sp.]MCW2746295.1 acyl carrier protein [Mycobacterium sp.]